MTASLSFSSLRSVGDAASIAVACGERFLRPHTFLLHVWRRRVDLYFNGLDVAILLPRRGAFRGFYAAF
jgi:hypothetical protein